MPSAETPRRHDIRSGSAASRVRSSVERHTKTGWYEWTLREFLRYLFGIGILGLILFVPLQMEFSWMPSGAPPIFDPSVVILFAVLAMLVVGIFASLAYRALWGDQGWVDRTIAHHRTGSAGGK